MTGSSKFWTWFLTGLLTFLIVVVVNLFIDDVLRGQWDLTDDDRYTLPDAAKRIAGKLEDVCTVKCYISDPLPSYLAHVPRALRTRLEEFQDAAGDLIEFEFIAPENESEEFLKDLEERKITPVQLQDSDGGKRITGAYYVWLVFAYGDQEQNLNLLQFGRDVISEADLLRRLPYEICQKLVKMTNPDASVGIMSDKKVAPQQLQQTGLFPAEASDSLMSLRAGIEATAAAPQEIDLSSGKPIPDDIDAVIIYRPDGLDERQVFEIDQALMKGKSVAILLDNYASIEVDRFMTDYQPQLQQGRIKMRALDHGMQEWLAHFGVNVEPGYVESEQSCVAVINRVQLTPRGFQPVSEQRRYPACVLVREENEDGKTGEISEDNPAFGGLAAVSMFTPVPMTLDESKLTSHASATGEVVLRTHEDSYVRTPKGGVLSLYAKGDLDIPSERQSYALCVALRGEFKSFFAGKTYGADNGADRPPRKGPNGADLPPLPSEEPKIEESLAPGQLWVFADADFCSELYLAQRIGLAQATGSQQAWQSARQASSGLMNVINGLTAGSDLVEIRKPSLVDRTLSQERIDEDRESIRFWSMALAPLIVVGLGLVRWMGRMALTGVASPGLAGAGGSRAVSGSGVSEEHGS